MRKLLALLLILPTLSYAAMVGNPYVAFPPAGGGSTCIQGIGIDVKAEWDATVSASYGGSGTTWANLADTGTAYDLTIQGAAFTGTAGDAAAYFAADPGDDFVLSGALTTFIKDMQKATIGDYWFAIALYYQTSGTGNQGFHSTKTGAAAAGVSNYFRGSHVVRNRTTTNVNFTAAASNNVNYVVIVSHNSTSNQTTVWLGTTSGETLAGPTASAGDGGQFKIGSYEGTTGSFYAGTRIYAAAMGAGYINDSQAGSIFSCYETDHSRDYTP